MKHPKELFELQLVFAQKMNELESAKPLASALLDYTHFYKHFGIEDWTFNTRNSTWQRYCSGIEGANDLLDYTYSFYLHERGYEEGKGKNRSYSEKCFSFDYNELRRRISIHFENNDPPEPGALSLERKPARVNEMHDLFKEINNMYPNAETVYGHSWLYNLDAYKRIFPPQYVGRLKVDHNCFRGFGLWGQFLDKYRNVKQDMADEFKQNVLNLEDVVEAESCFRFQVLETEVPISAFYEFYQI